MEETSSHNRSEAAQLSQYLDAIQADEDKVLFKEAVSCAASNARRAAYVMVWISCAESLKRRFREISPRDHEARKIDGEIQRLERDQKAVDKFLLQKAKDYGLISLTGFARLEHVYQMRCVYGHPYETAPTTEDLVSAASTVVDTVLSKPLKLREGYLSSQAELITKQSTFLDDTPIAVKEYAREVFYRVDEEKHNWFLNKLWTAANPWISDPSMFFFVRRVTWFSQAYLACEALSIFNSRDHRDDLIRFPNILMFVYSDQDLFPNLQQHPQDMVVGSLIALSSNDASVFRRFEKLDDHGVLPDRARERLLEAMNQIEVTRLINKAIHPRYYLHRIVESLKAHNWYVQNPAIQNLRNLDYDKLRTLDPASLRSLGNNILQAAQGGAGAARKYMEDIGSGGLEALTDIVLGVFEETVINERNEVRFKTEYSKQAAQSLGRVPEATYRQFIEDLAARVREGDWKHSFSADDANTYVQSLRSAQEEIQGDFSVIDVLIHSIESKEPPENAMGNV